MRKSASGTDEHTAQPDGSVKKVIDQDMRQHISMKLLEALPSFQMGQE